MPHPSLVLPHGTPHLQRGVPGGCLHCRLLLGLCSEAALLRWPGHVVQLVNQVTVPSILHQVVLQTDNILILLYLHYKKAKQTNKQKHAVLTFPLEGKRVGNQRNLQVLKVNQSNGFQMFDSKSKDELCFISQP